MADARILRTMTVAVVVLLLVVCYLITRIQNQHEIARVKGQVSRLEGERDSIQAVVAANVSVQETLTLTREHKEAEVNVLRDYVDLLEQRRSESALTVRRIRKTSDLQVRLDSTFPEIPSVTLGV